LRGKKTWRLPLRTSSPAPAQPHKYTHFQGTIYLRDGIWTGSSGVVGGTKDFKRLEGEEQLVFNTNTGAGTIKYLFK
jgi:hypothetical protein